MHYVITPSGAVESFAARPAANARANALGKPAAAVSSEADLLKVPGSLLVKVYNIAASESDSKANTITKFADQKAAAKRTWPVVDYLARPGTVSEVAPTTTEGSTVAKTKKLADGITAGRPHKLAGTTLTKLVDVEAYPRRKGSKAYEGSWGCIRNGMSYESFLKAGGVPKHLLWDIAHKFIKAS